MTQLSGRDRDLVIRTIIGEASSEGSKGWAAVAHVIRNRTLSDRFPNSAGAVATQGANRKYAQFSTWNAKSRSGNHLPYKYKKGDRRYEQVGAVVDAVFTGKAGDPTGGATHYYAPNGMKDKKPPKWWNSEVKNGGGVVKIGGHRFAGDPKKVGRAGLPASTPNNSSSPSIVMDQDMVPIAAPTNKEQRERQQLEEAAITGGPSLVELGGIARDQWSVMQLWQQMDKSRTIYDPEFELTSDLIDSARQAGVNQTYIGDLASSKSIEEYDFLIQNALRKQEQDHIAAKAGIPGMVAAVAGAFSDPVALVASVGTEGALAPAVYGGKLSRIGKALRVGGVGSAASLSADLAVQAVSPEEFDAKQAAMAAATGLIVGGAVGSLSRKAGLSGEALKMEKAGQALAKEIESGIDNMSIRQPLGAAGAQRVSSIEALGPDDAMVYDSNVAYAFGKGLRYSSSGQLGSSNNPFVRSIYDHIGLDSVGKSDNSVVNIAASERQHRIQRSWIVEREQLLRPAWKEYLKRNQQKYKQSGGWWTSKQNTRQAFEEDITAYIRSRGSRHTENVDPAVKRVGDWWVSKAREIGRQAQNPMGDEGVSSSRSVYGFNNFVENDYYVPRIINHRAIWQLEEEFGTGPLEEFFKQAFWRGNPELDEAVATRVGRAYLRRLKSIGAGVEDDTARALNNADLDEIRNVIGELEGLQDGDLEAVVSHLDWLEQSKKAKGTGTSRGKRRVLFDEGFEAEVSFRHGGGSRTVRFDEFLVNGFSSLSQKYFRDLSGWIALAKVQVRNPTSGELMINGITSDADWSKLVRTVRKTGRDAGLSKEQIDKDVSNLDFLYGQIRGIPDELDSQKLGQWMRRLRDFNFTRVMNQTGFPSMSEISTVASSVGIKALASQMPAFRRVIDKSSGRLVRGNPLAAEVEAIWGFGADRLLGGLDFRWDHFGDHLGMDKLGAQSKMLDKLDGGLARVREITSDVGLLRPVTQTLQQWTARAVLQKFGQLAKNGGKKPDLALLRSLGFKTDDDLDLVLSELNKHGTFTKGLLGDKLVQFNPEKWDPVAVSILKDTVYRWTRRAVQENDPGMMHRWMSKPMMRIMFQFRSFMLASYEAQFLHNIHAFKNGGQFRAFSFFVGSLLSAAGFHALRVQANAVGMEEARKREYLDRHMSASSLAAAAFSRSAWSSFMPGVADTVVGLAGGDPIFSYRSSGLSSALWGNPSTDLLDDAYEFTSSLGDSFREDRPLSKKELQSGASILPWQNSLPFVGCFPTW